MIALRCTHRLLKRLGATPEADVPPPTSALGNWYANLVYVGRAQFVMATSERSLLTVLLPASNLRRSLVPNLRDAAALLLREIGVDDARASKEVEAMREVRYSRTESRSVLGSMNDFSKSLDWYLHDGIAPLECMLRFADTPMTGLGSAGESHGYPAEAARSLLGVEGQWSRLAPQFGK
ncbi:MAG: hypothetical protein ABI648_17525 [Betaproteobacteria bacterium]